MSSDGSLARRKLPLVKLALAAIVVGAVAFFLLRGMNFRDLGTRGMALIRDAGPWAFFSAAAVLPAFSAPLSLFTLVAAEAFAKQMTMAGVIAAMLVSITVNLALTYWIARYALRPFLSRLLGSYGYSIPRVTPKNALSVILVLRLTPGPPFFIQSYILGLAEAPFRLYMVASFICNLPWTIAFVVLGKGIFNGNFTLVLTGVGVIVVASVAVHWIRKRYAPRAD